MIKAPEGFGMESVDLEMDDMWPFKLDFLLCLSCPLDDLIVIIFSSCTLRSPLSAPAHLALSLAVPEWQCWHSVHGTAPLFRRRAPYINHRLSSFSISLSLPRVSELKLSNLQKLGASFQHVVQASGQGHRWRIAFISASESERRGLSITPRIMRRTSTSQII